MHKGLSRVSGAMAVSSILLLGASAQVGAVEVVDFAEIQASPIVIDFDPSGKVAVLNVETSLDLACAVVYGTDETFGLIAVDQDMDGGAHDDHHPFMTGLEPDTDYLYRLQGSDANGLLYQSETFSFRTPPAPEAGAPNLALGATVVEVSSQFSDAYSGAKAIDGDPSTEWSSAGDGDGAFITLDLGSPQQIDTVAFRTRQMSDGSAITDTFIVTVDGTELGPFPVSDDLVTLGVEGQIIRFDVVSTTGGNTGAVEVEVFGPES